MSSVLEEFLAEELMHEGVLAFNVNLDKIEKFTYLRLFTSSIMLRGN